MEKARPCKRLLSMVLSVMLILSALPNGISAAETDTAAQAPASIITAFDDLAAEIKKQEVDPGTAEAELELPATVKAAVQTGDAQAALVDVPVNWTASPAYDAVAETETTFTASPQDAALTIAESVEVPTIAVKVKASVKSDPQAGASVAAPAAAPALFGATDNYVIDASNPDISGDINVKLGTLSPNGVLTVSTNSVQSLTNGLTINVPAGNTVHWTADVTCASITTATVKFTGAGKVVVSGRIHSTGNDAVVLQGVEITVKDGGLLETEAFDRSAVFASGASSTPSNMNIEENGTVKGQNGITLASGIKTGSVINISGGFVEGSQAAVCNYASPSNLTLNIDDGVAFSRGTVAVTGVTPLFAGNGVTVAWNDTVSPYNIDSNNDLLADSNGSALTASWDVDDTGAPVVHVKNGTTLVAAIPVPDANVNKLKFTGDSDFTISGNTVTYNGNAQTLKVGHADFEKTPGAVISLEYNGSVTAPADAGDYAVTIKTSGNPRYEDYASPASTTTFKIKKASIKITDVTLKSKVYDGTVKGTADKISAMGLMTPDVLTAAKLDYSDAVFSDANAAVGIATSVKVNGFKAGADLAKNYIIQSASIANPFNGTADITPAKIKVTGVTAGGNPYSGKVYDGNTDANDVDAVIFSGLKNSEALTAGTDYDIVSKAFDSSAVGNRSFDIKVKLASPSTLLSRNYELSDVQGKYTLTGFAITKLGAPSDLEENRTVTVGKTGPYEVDLDGILSSAGMLSMLDAPSYTIVDTGNDSAVNASTVAVNGNKLIYNSYGSAGVGKETKLQVAVTSNNHNTFTITINVKVVAKEELTLAFDKTPDKTMTYTGQPYVNNAIVSAEKIDGTPVTVGIDPLYTSTDGGTYSNAVPPADAGKYKVTYTVDTANPDYQGTLEHNFEIKKAGLTVQSVVLQAKVYDGNNSAAVTDATVTGMKNNEVYTVTDFVFTDAKYTDKNAADNKTGEAKVTGFSSGSGLEKNYTVSTKATAAIAGTGSISKAELTLKGAKSKGANFTGKPYDGTAAAEIDEVVFGGVVGTDNLVAGTDYTIAGATLDSAVVGTGRKLSATVALTATQAAQNYTLKAGNTFGGTYKITAGTPQVTTATVEVVAGKPVTNTEDIRAILGQAYYNDSGAVTYKTPSFVSINGGVVTAAPSINADGLLSYDVAASSNPGKETTIKIPIESTNYGNFDFLFTVKAVDRFSVDISLNQNLATKEYTGLPYVNDGVPVFTYNGTALAPTALKASDLEVLYTNQTSTAAYSSKTAPTNAGKYTVTYTVKSNNTTYKGTASFDFEISKAKLSIDSSTVTIGAKTYDGSVDADVLTLDLNRISINAKEAALNMPANYTAKGEFDTREPGTGKTVTVTVTLNADAAKNYTLSKNTVALLNQEIKKIAVADVIVNYQVIYKHNWNYQVDYNQLLPVLNPAISGASFGAYSKADSESLIKEIKNTTSPKGLYIDGEIPGDNQVGDTAAVTIPVTSKYHDDFNIIVNIEVVDKEVLTIAAPEFQSKTYDGTKHAYKGKPAVTNSKGKDVSAQVTLEVWYTDANGQNPTKTAPTDAGDYQVFAKVKGDDAQYMGESAKTNFTIYKATLIPGKIVLTEKTYDGKVDAAVKSVALEGFQNGEKLKMGTDFTVSAVFATKDADDTAAADVTINLLSTDLGKNYEFAGGVVTVTVPVTGTIKKAPLTIAGATVDTKDYDGDLNAVVTEVVFDGFQNGESFTTGDYTVTGKYKDNANAGTDKTVNINVILNSNTLTDNYEVVNNNFESENNTINKANASDLTDTFYAVHSYAKEYAYDIAELLNDSEKVGIAYTNVITEDGWYDILEGKAVMNVSALEFKVKSTASAGEHATIEVTISSANYRDRVLTLTVEITEKQVVDIERVNVAGGEYNGEAYGTLNTADIRFRNIATGMLVTDNMNYTVEYTSDNDGKNYKSSKAPVDAGKYKLTITVSKENAYYQGTADSLFEITRKPITIDSIVLADKTYDGNTSGTVSKAAVSGTLPKETLVFDNDFIAYAQFDTADAGDKTKNADVTVILTSERAKNYCFTVAGQPSDTAMLNLTEQSIAQRKLTIQSAVISEKAYNGTTAANVTDVVLKNVVTGDSLNLNTEFTAAGTYNKADAGKRKVTVVVTLIPGTVSDNYYITEGFDVTGQNITKAAAPVGVSETFNAVKQLRKEYTYSLEKLLAVLGQGESYGELSYEVRTIQDNDKILERNPTISKDNKDLELTVNEVPESGRYAVLEVVIKSENYENYTSTLMVEIVEKEEITFRGIEVTDSVYNGMPHTYNDKNAEFLDSNNVKIDEPIYLDVRYTSTDGKGYDSEEAPTQAGNYLLTLTVSNQNQHYKGQNSYNFIIEQRQLTIQSAEIAEKTYDGTDEAEITQMLLTGFVNNEGFKYTFPKAYSATGTYDSKNAGMRTVTVTAVLLDTALNNNYIVPNTFDVENQEILQKEIGISGAKVAGKTYNGKTNVKVNEVSFSGLVTPEILLMDADFTATGTFDNKNAGTAKTVAVAVTLENTVTADNYVLKSNTFDLKGQTIKQAPLTITSADVDAKIYDGNTTVAVKNTVLDGLKNQEKLEDGKDYTVTGTYNTADAGTDKSVTVKVTLNNTATANNYVVNHTFLLTNKTIEKKEVVVTPADVRINRGESLPEIQVSYKGFVVPDTAETTLAAKALAGYTADNMTAGTSAINITTDAVLNGEAGKNYTLTNAEAKLTVADTLIISYDANGGLGEKKVLGLKASQDYIIERAAEAGITRAGYTFEGWNIQADGKGTSYSARTMMKLKTDLTLFAQWKEITGPTLVKDGDHKAYVFGYSDGSIKPTNNLTRAEAAMLFYRLLSDETRAQYATKSTNLTDLCADNWYFEAAATLANAGIITGYPDKTFRGHQQITRAEFATMAAKFSGCTYQGNDRFPDISNSWAKAYINCAASAGWINGRTNGTFDPGANIIRAEAITIFNRMMGRGEEGAICEGAKTFVDCAPGKWYYYAIMEATNSHDYYLDQAGNEVWLSITD